MGDTWYLDEVFITIRGKRYYLWRAVDQDSYVLDILVQKQRAYHAAKVFFRKLLKGECQAPRCIVTDKLRSYGAARREVMPSVMHSQGGRLNNRAEVSHQPSRHGRDRCGVSNHMGRRNVFFPPMALSIIRFALVVIY